MSTKPTSNKKTTAPVSTPAPRPEAEAADQALWDGYTLTLFERIVRVFTAGRAVDPTIPRLVPIALYRWYFGYESAAAKTDDVPASPSPP